MTNLDIFVELNFKSAKAFFSEGVASFGRWELSHAKHYKVILLRYKKLCRPMSLNLTAQAHL